jgi:deoxyribodipyrimidine photolyase-related protein
MVGRLVLVLGDQLSMDLSALRQADKSRDVVLMVEAATETRYAPHHPKKIALVLGAMRKFAQSLRDQGWTVRYVMLDDPENTGSIVGELLRHSAHYGAGEVLATQPGEWRLIEALQTAPLLVRLLEDDRFIASHSEFQDWARGRKELRMEYFYRLMRRKTGLLMDGDKPIGGRWNFDAENRKALPKGLEPPAPLKFPPDAGQSALLDMIADRFSDHFGDLRPFWFAVTRDQALQALDHFVAQALPLFGDYQDAMRDGQRFLYHSVLSAYINIGLLGPLEVCERVQAAYVAGAVPLNAAEGFIRQIIGWREYVRGIYFLKGPDYTRQNALDHHRDLPGLYWGAPTGMRCLSQAVEQTKTEAYAHHIQRLMITGNFALLAGIDPAQVHDWYLAVYADAFEWVEAPNTIGMSQFADGGVIASKPYVSSGSYIHKMSDYCGRCDYAVKVKTGPDACPFNLLYWHFLDRHRARFAGNPRMGNMYRVWDKMDAEKQRTILREAQQFLDDLV